MSMIRQQGDPVLSSGVEAVRIRDLHRAFDGRTVLAGLDLTLVRGEFVALLGRSGSGKSTLLRILAGFDGEVEGEVLIPKRRAIVFQEPRLLPWARVLPNVMLGLSGADARAHAVEALAEVGLADRHDAWPVTLSGGEAQRVALARALVREPDLLMLDEPFGALDALTQLRMHALLQKLCARHRPAVIFVTHDVDEAIALADRIVVLKDGRVSIDLPVPGERPRPYGHARFGGLRDQLLRELGVETAEDAL